MKRLSISSNETFLRCTNIGVVEVYELNNLHDAPVKSKYWCLLKTIRLGALNIGNREIRGTRLKAALQDLFDSRLLVNREGLCFLPSDGVGTSDGGKHNNKVEYYRIFDRFDWEKYGAKPRMTSRWICKDVLQGRPLVIHSDDDDDDSNTDDDDNSNTDDDDDYYSNSDEDDGTDYDNDDDDNNNTEDDYEQCKKKLSDKEKELEEEERKHEKEVQELKIKHEEEIEKEKLKIQVKLAELEKKEGEIKAEQQSIVAKLNEELIRRDPRTCGVQTELVNRVRIRVPSEKLQVCKLPLYFDVHDRPVPSSTGASLVCNDTPRMTQDLITMSYFGNYQPTVDLQNWWAVSSLTLIPRLNHHHREEILVYYDGSYGTTSCSDGSVMFEVPIPVKREDFPKLVEHKFLHIVGVGTRFVLRAQRA